MPHPDKANGQQAHDNIRMPVILRTLLLAVFLGVACLPVPAPAETADLRDVRMADHGTYTRVVFEFSAPVQYGLSENAAAGIVSIRFLETTSQLTKIPVPGPPKCIDSVSTVQDGSHTIADIAFARKWVTLNPFKIQGPDRIVLDVFCDAGPVAPVALSEPKDVTPAPISVAEPADEKPVTARSVKEQKETPDHPDRILKKSEPASKRDNSQKYLLLILAAITGIIVLLIALIIFQKRNLSESRMTGNADTTRETDDMMRSLDMKIKEKLMKYDQ